MGRSKYVYWQWQWQWHWSNQCHPSAFVIYWIKLRCLLFCFFFFVFHDWNGVVKLYKKKVEWKIVKILFFDTWLAAQRRIFKKMHELKSFFDMNFCNYWTRFYLLNYSNIHSTDFRCFFFLFNSLFSWLYKKKSLATKII